MQNSYTSVTQFYLDLKQLLLTEAAMTIVRTIGSTDHVLDAGDGTFLRLQKKTNGSVMSVSLDLGSDPDVLSAQSIDPDRCFPFSIQAEPKEFAPTCYWVPEERFLSFCFVSEDPSKRYRADFRFRTASRILIHQDRFHPEYEPNFKDTGGPFILAGA